MQELVHRTYVRNWKQMETHAKQRVFKFKGAKRQLHSTCSVIVKRCGRHWHGIERRTNWAAFWLYYGNLSLLALIHTCKWWLLIMQVQSAQPKRPFLRSSPRGGSPPACFSTCPCKTHAHTHIYPSLSICSLHRYVVSASADPTLRRGRWDEERKLDPATGNRSSCGFRGFTQGSPWGFLFLQISP